MIKINTTKTIEQNSKINREQKTDSLDNKQIFNKIFKERVKAKENNLGKKTEESKKQVTTSKDISKKDLDNLQKQIEDLGEKEEALPEDLKEVLTLLLNYFKDIMQSQDKDSSLVLTEEEKVAGIGDQGFSQLNTLMEKINNLLKDNAIEDSKGINLFEALSSENEILEKLQGLVDTLLSKDEASMDKSKKDLLSNIKALLDSKLGKGESDLANSAIESQGYLNSTKENLISTLAQVPKEENLHKEVQPKEEVKEEKLLNNLIKGSDEGKNNKLNLWMNNLNKVSLEEAPAINTESIAINRATLQQDLIKAVKFMDLKGMKELTVKVYPKELGEITIRLTMEAGAMKANLSTNNKDTYSLLNANINELKSSISMENIKISEVAINIYSEDTTFFKNEFSKGEGNEQRHNSSSHSNSKGNAISTEEIGLEEALVQREKLLRSNISMLV